MPVAFGVLVQAELEIMMLAGPGVADPREGLWTFLTQPANTRSPAVPADLLASGVRLIPTGVVLPTSTDRSESVLVGRSTRTQPDLGIWSAVIGAARRVAYRLARCGTR